MSGQQVIGQWPTVVAKVVSAISWYTALSPDFTLWCHAKNKSYEISFSMKWGSGMDIEMFSESMSVHWSFEGTKKVSGEWFEGGLNDLDKTIEHMCSCLEAFIDEYRDGRRCRDDFRY